MKLTNNLYFKTIKLIYDSLYFIYYTDYADGKNLESDLIQPYVAVLNNKFIGTNIIGYGGIHTIIKFSHSRYGIQMNTEIHGLPRSYYHTGLDNFTICVQ